MKRKTFLTLICFLHLSIVTAMAEDETFSGEMVMDGSWHGDEVSAQDGETWLALVEGPGGYALREIKISVTAVEDAVLDTPPAKTGKKISLPQGIDAVVLLRNIPRLKAGPVVSAEIFDRDFSAGKPTGIYFNGVVYELAIRCDNATQGQETADCPLMLTSADNQQVFMTYPIYHPGTDEQSIASEALPQLFWAGDLDGDGRLDLVLDLTDHYNVSAPTLLLSSQAEEGGLLKAVAVFRTTGC